MRVFRNPFLGSIGEGRRPSGPEGTKHRRNEVRDGNRCVPEMTHVHRFTQERKKFS